MAIFGDFLVKQVNFQKIDDKEFKWYLIMEKRTLSNKLTVLVVFGLNDDSAANSADNFESKFDFLQK